MTEDEKFHRHALSKKGMQAAHLALTARHPWFFHVSEIALFDEIKAKGITRHNPGCTPPPLVVEALREDATEFICLTPQGSFDATPNRSRSRFRMAIASQDLPRVIGLDWSYGGVWPLPAIIKQDTPNTPDDEVFCEVVRRRGSVVVYEALSTSIIRAWCKGTLQDDPSSWPFLADVERSDLEVF